MPMKEKKFSRRDPDERKDLLTRAAIRCLQEEGYAGLSVRKITKEANVSQGMINLHFGSINQLIASAYDLLSTEFYQFIADRLDQCHGTALEKMDLFFQTHFSSQWMNPKLLKAWLVFWSLLPDTPEMAEAYERNNGKVEALLRQLLTQISVEDGLQIDDMASASQRLMALLDGIWVRQNLEQRTAPSDYALEMARDWLARFRTIT
ncbi:TetR family transcriptional regulator [Marinomonas agarivorans]|nr:TetR family transcriptional regulator [Marinomonas agarivorans]